MSRNQNHNVPWLCMHNALKGDVVWKNVRRFKIKYKYNNKFNNQRFKFIPENLVK